MIDPNIKAWSKRMNAIEILRQIVAKTDGGPGACMGRNADGSMAWKGSFRALLLAASDAAGAEGPILDHHNDTEVSMWPMPTAPAQPLAPQPAP